MEIYFKLTNFNNVYSDINIFQIFYILFLFFYAMKTKLYENIDHSGI